MSKLRNILSRNFYNMRGWTTDRKIVVIESDDWGSIRMPSKEVYNKFYNKGYPVNKKIYEKYDSLASEDDLSALFEVLKSVKDKNNSNAVFTANSVVANPNFEKIKESNFHEYHYETFIDTLKSYGKSHENSWDLWRQGIENNIFYPQSHGREHFNIPIWLKMLKNNDIETLEAFNNKMVGITSPFSISKGNRLMIAYNFEEDINFCKNSIVEALKLFENIFKYKSVSFIAPCYTWSNNFNFTFKDNGVKILQGSRFQSYPQSERNEKHGEYRRMGQKENGLTYIVRNCYFEPTEFGNEVMATQECLNQIKSAFFWKKPAVISSHRINYIGSIDESNRKKNLVQLSILLNQIIKKWPDVEFMTSNELGELI